MNELTPDLVKAFWAHMTGELGATVEEKNSSAVMQAAAVLLDALNIQDKEQFLKDFVTTLVCTIYTPFKVGEVAPDGRWSLWSQLRVCVHECQHVVQGEREGWATFGSRYLSSSSWRAGYEAEAFGCDLEMEYWRQGEAFDVVAFAQDRPEVLRSYGCDQADIDQAQAQLLIRAGVVQAGVVENKATQLAIAWLEANAPGLRGA